MAIIKPSPDTAKVDFAIVFNCLQAIETNGDTPSDQTIESLLARANEETVRHIVYVFVRRGLTRHLPQASEVTPNPT